MDILVYILLALLTLRLFVTLINYFFRPYLPTVRRIKDAPLISLLVHGDNEQRRMRYIIELFKRLHYPSLEIIVGIYNPQGLPLDQIYQAAALDKRVRIHEINQLRKGWREDSQINSILGTQARGNYLLFMDPVVELRGGILEILVSYMRSNKLGLISVFPSYEVNSKAEWLTFPILNQLYLSLYLLRRMEISLHPKASLASDKFMLFEGEVYRQFQPFEEVKSGRNVAREIAAYLKRESINVDWRIGDKRVRLLGYVSLKRCMASISHELTHFFGKYYIMGFIYGIIMCFWWIPFIITQSWGLLILGLLETIVAQVLLAGIVKVSAFRNILYFFPQMLVLLSVLWVSVIHRIHMYKKERMRHSVKR